MFEVDLLYTLAKEKGESRRLKNDLIEQLSTIESEKSLMAAAKKLGMSYRYFWGRIEHWENEFGQKLVVREQGKPAFLTPLGKKLLWAERTIQAKHALTIAKLSNELNAAFQAAYDPNASILTVAGCFDAFLSSLQVKAFDSGLITDFRFNTGLEGLRNLRDGDCVMAGFNFPEDSPRGSEAWKAFSPMIDPALMEGCSVGRRSQGLVVAKGNPKGVGSFIDVFLKHLRYAGRSPDTGTYTLQESLLKQTPFDQEQLAKISTIYPSHLAVATAVASGEADAGLCIAQAAGQMNAGFIPLVWENYYLAWHKRDRALVQPFLEVLSRAGREGDPGEPGRDLQRCGELITDWQAELNWF